MQADKFTNTASVRLQDVFCNSTWHLNKQLEHDSRISGGM